ncbi:MAG: OmpH family outer membrane protein [Thermodesulfobacteriota bacterium]|nr:OmpH family outer membrane protein [Thermodesulfobacteriota bacterium]
MKKVVSLLIVISFMLTGVCFAGAQMMGFINMKEILLSSDAGKAATIDLKKFVDERRTQIQGKEDTLKKMKETLEKQRSVLPEAAYKEKELSYQKELRDYKRFIEDTNGEMRVKEQELSRKLVPEVVKVVGAIGKREGYTSIADVNSGGLVFYSEKNDITQKVMEEYNKAYKSGR